MRAGLTPCETVVEDGLELPQFLYEPFHITGSEVKRGDGEGFAFGSTGW
jgi:hypothetical protein